MVIDAQLLAPVFEHSPVVAAYLFGSQAAGTATKLSDDDIAVILEPGVPSPGSVQAALMSDLMLVLRRSDVDVVVLNSAPPLLKERAISRGRLIYCRDETARVRFEVAARREYFDTQPLRDAQDDALLSRYTAER
jgi:predicted nucleotidyltransferase